ncbi:MAG: hypothetical protein K6B41_05345 [Butyrivibrio sp.]|nr:hypothetical protein [Butyrivibrio sp.]
MSNRFSYEKEKSIPGWVGIVINFSIMMIIFIVFIVSLHVASQRTIIRQQQSLENAITRDIAQCYSLEGRYPPSLEYLQSHYGLTFDENTFFVDYQPIASNLYPDVTVILLK